ncbi:hypothetical protein DFH06DRAFT_1207248 [Mycena polygramma]|nr:hypothetical protein DFH06DRAFT_1207248 [Mycena polygramma]
MSLFLTECQALAPGLPFPFSPRVTIENYDHDTLFLAVNCAPFQATTALSVRCADGTVFPTGGFEFVSEDTELVTRIHTAGLADQEQSLSPILAALTTFLGKSEPQVIPVPDQKTHIVGVLGPADLTDEENEWIACDYALLYHTLGGCAATEKWLTPVSLHSHVRERGNLLHGAGTQARRVVLDESSPMFYSVVTDVHRAFDSALREVVASATELERIMIIVCAHGERATGSVSLGGSRFSVTRMKGILCQSKAPATILTTACFSGLWALPYPNPRSGLDLVTTFASTTGSLPSYSFPVSASDRIRGGKFASTVVSTIETFATPIDAGDDAPRTLPPTCLAGMVVKVIDTMTFTSTTAARAARVEFSDFAQTVQDKMTQAQHPNPSLFVPTPDHQSQTNSMLGLQDEVALLYRLVALKELPVIANYTTLPLAVQQVTPRVLTGSVEPDVQIVQARVDQYFTVYSAPIDPNLVAPSDMRLWKGVRNLINCGATARRQLLSDINVRIELDDGAERLAEHIARLGSTVRAPRPSILRWSAEEYSAVTMGELAVYFIDEVQEKLSPGWREALGCVSGSPVYEKPGCFLAFTSYQYGYRTVGEAAGMVTAWFAPPSPRFLNTMHSAPNLSSIDQRIETLTHSLSLTAISS